MPLNPENLKPIKVLFFDVFGTVVDWRASIIRSLSDAASQAVTNDSSLESLAKRADWDEFATAWRGEYQKYTRAVGKGEAQSRPIEEKFKESLGQLLDERGLRGLFSEAELDRLAQAWGRLDGWPDSANGLRDLQRLGLRTCTLTNGSQSLMAAIAQHADLPWSHIYCGEDWKSTKPDPRVYLGAVAAEGVEPGETALVAAHLYDLDAAAKLGMRTIYVERAREEHLDAAEVSRILGSAVDHSVSLDQPGFEAVARDLARIRGAA